MFLCNARCCGCPLSGCPDPLPKVLHATDNYGAFVLNCVPGGGYTGTHSVSYPGCNACSPVSPLLLTYSLTAKGALRVTYPVSVGFCPGALGATTLLFPTASGTCSPVALTFTDPGTAAFSTLYCGFATVTVTP